MTEVLHIGWYTGHMDINMRAFFPCTVANYKKLLQVIRMDLEHENDIMQTLQRFFSDMVQVKDEEWRTESKNFWNYQQKEADMCHIIKDKKFPNGLPLNKEQMAYARECMKEYAAQKRVAKRAAVKAKKDKDWFMQKVEGGESSER